MMSPPTSPPRRARGPQIPAPYLSTSFSAAQHALHLVSQPPTTRDETLASLRDLRAEISSVLHTSAPPWSVLAPAIASLTESLRTTQSATLLANNLSHLSAHPHRDYPARMSVVVSRASHLTAVVSLSSSVRQFATLLSAVNIAVTAHVTSTDPRFLAVATALHRAFTAAITPPLANIPCLHPIRLCLTRRHAALLADIHLALIDGIYAGVLSLRRLAPELAAAMPTSPLISASPPPTASPSIASPPSPALCPELARAVDILSSPGAAARALSQAATARLTALIRRSVMAECAPPVRTVASLASSSFTAAPTNTPTLSVYSVTSSSSRAVMHVFSNHLPRASRIACASVFERVRLQMTGVLRRLSQLAEAVADDLPHLPDAMHAIWETMECELVLFVRTLLAFPTSRYSKDIKEHGQYGISLLPGVSRRGSEGNLGHRQQQPCTWELQRGQSSLDSFVTLVNSIPTLSPSIYNLEVMYSPLQQFILNSSRLQEAWRDKTSPSLGEHGSIRSTLPFLLSRAVDIFVKTVREDVAQYMDNAFGSRAGTLLQPLSMRQRVSHVTSSSQSNILPPLPQTQMLIDVIASCLSLGVAIPSVASRLGEVINNEVIMPFCERAIYALKLAASWTDAGSLVNELVASGAHCAASLSNVTDTSYYVAKQKGPWNTPTVSSDGGEWRELTIHYISQMFEKRKQVKTVSARLLVESEWNAVVRLVANAKFVISELESCMGKSSETMSGGMVADANGSGEGHDGSRLLSLRGILNERGISSGLHGTIVEAIQKTEKGCRILREDVIERGLVLLHCEIALQCFSEVVKSLSIDCSKANGMVKASRGSVKVAKKAEGRTKKKKKNGKALSSMFPISKMGDNLESEGSDDFSSGMPEYDEFGDRIVLVNDTTTDEEIEDCTFPNSLVIGQNDWKGHCKQEEDESEDMQVGPKKGIDDCSKLDRDIMESARVFGEVLSQKDVCISENLSSADRDFIFSQADGSMALGISFSGKMRMTGDRDVATAARTFMDCVAGVAAESIGWSIVESNYSIAEGGSQSASECRSLLCAADMLQIEAKQ